VAFTTFCSRSQSWLESALFEVQVLNYLKLLEWLLNEIGMLTTKLTELLSDMNTRVELLCNNQNRVLNAVDDANSD
jgi:hypothetical protein